LVVIFGVSLLSLTWCLCTIVYTCRWRGHSCIWSVTSSEANWTGCRVCWDVGKEMAWPLSVKSRSVWSLVVTKQLFLVGLFLLRF